MQVRRSTLKDKSNWNKEYFVKTIYKIKENCQQSAKTAKQ